MQTPTIQSLNADIAAKTRELAGLSTASGLYEVIQAERSDLIRQRDALIHSPAVDKPAGKA